MADRKQLARKELARRELERRKNPEQSRESQEFMSPVPTAEQSKNLNVGGVAKGVAGRALGNVAAGLQREEAVATQVAREAPKLSKGQKTLTQLLATTPLSPIVFGAAMSTKPSVVDAARGETAPELGDLYRDAGVPEPLAATLGLITAGGLPSSFAGSELLKKMGILKGAKPKPTRVAKATAQLLGVQQDVLEDTAKRGFRKVLQKKFFDRRLPAVLQEKIISASDEISNAAKSRFDEATEALRGVPFDADEFNNSIGKFFRKSKVSPFRGAQKDFNESIRRGFVEATEGKTLNNMGDLLDTRQFLDKEIRVAKRQSIDTSFATKVRGIINEQLHKNDTLKTADEIWYNLSTQVDSILDKVSKDTGETLLGRFQSLPRKTQQRLLEVQDFLRRSKAKAGLPPGEDIIREVIDSSLAREFLPKTQRATVARGSLLERILLPTFRFSLRTGELGSPVAQAGRTAARQLAVPTARQAGQ